MRIRRHTEGEHAGADVADRPPNRRCGRLAWNDRAKVSAKLVVMLVVSVAVVGAACGRGDDEATAGSATSTTRLLEVAPAPDPVTADGVAVVALREIYTWKPTVEAPGASLSRARKWLGPSLIRLLDSAPTGLAAPPAPLQWSDWAKAKATVDAFTFAAGERPPAGPDPAVQQFQIGVEQTVVYPGGRKERLSPTMVIATVVRTADGWRLDAYR